MLLTKSRRVEVPAISIADMRPWTSHIPAPWKLPGENESLERKEEEQQVLDFTMNLEGWLNQKMTMTRTAGVLT